MRQKRSDPDVKAKESKSRKTKRQNTIIYQIEAERNKKAMQKRRKSDMYKEKEMFKKKDKALQFFV